MPSDINVVIEEIKKHVHEANKLALIIFSEDFFKKLGSPSPNGGPQTSILSEMRSPDMANEENRFRELKDSLATLVKILENKF
jgi:hypothetical protein